VIAADMSFGDRGHNRYRAHVNDPGGGLTRPKYRSTRAL
jgi:hypothetical protein